MAKEAGKLPNKHIYAFSTKELRLFPHHWVETVNGPNENRSVDINLLIEAFNDIGDSELSARNKKRAYNHLKSHAKTMAGSDDFKDFHDDLTGVLEEFASVEWVDYEPVSPKFITTKNEKIFKAGTWNKSEYSVEDLQIMVDTYNAVDYEPPLKRSHLQFCENALGYAKGLYVDGEYVVAEEFSYPAKVYEEEIENKSLRYKSAEIWKDYEQDGVVYKYMLKAVALLGISTPAVVGLEELNVQEFSSDDPNKSFYVFDSEQDTIVTMDRKEKEMADEIKKDETPTVSVEQFDALTAQMKASLDAFEAYKTEAKADADAKAEEFKAKVDAMQTELNSANEVIANLNDEGRRAEDLNFAANLVKDGKLAPKDKDAVVALFEALNSDKHVALFSADDKDAVETGAVEIFKSFLNGLKAWEAGEVSKEVKSDEAPVVPGKDSAEERTFTTDRHGNKVEVSNVSLAEVTQAVIKEYAAKDEKITYREAARIADKRMKGEK